MKQTATLETATLERAPRRLQIPWRPRYDLVWPGLARLGALVTLALLLLTVSSSLLAGLPDLDTANSRRLQQTVARALDEDTTTPGRLVRVGLTAWGDLSVEFVLRDQGDARANTRQALADTLAIARSVYQGPEPRPLTITVVGLAALPSPAAARVPVLYASLPADRLAGLDWTRVQPDDLPGLAGLRWLPTGVCQAWKECPPDQH